ncbi:hypothetical protein KKI93_24450, partial [Xenorhabdus bovienii]|uniref:hypothetical protein n=1 Tax=Xenorhabdus bovienii TaxID=40576 RepID=UPI002A73084B|nr:hypothetical protein [Xenorhabdus bovienii]
IYCAGKIAISALYCSGERAAGCMYLPANSNMVEFCPTPFINFPSCPASNIISRLDVIANFGIGK